MTSKVHETHQIPKQTCLAQQHFMGIWGLTETDKSQEKWLERFSVTCTFRRDACLETYKNVTEISLRIFFLKRMLTMPVTQDECSLAAVTWTIGRIVIFLVGLLGNFSSLFQSLAKMGTSCPAQVTWPRSALWGGANTHPQGSPQDAICTSFQMPAASTSTHVPVPSLGPSPSPTTSHLCELGKIT